jgi:FMN-dependent NADH-azoreductase
MAKVLHIQVSPREERSHSRKVAEAFLEVYQETNRGDEVATLDLFQAALPTFDGFVIQAKYNIMHGREHSEEQANAWREVEAVIEQFMSADKYVVSNPMWNFGISYRLKQYIDIITQPGYTFSVDENGYKGLVTGKPVVLIHACGGGGYTEGDMAAMDFQARYLETLFGFLGFTDIRQVRVEGMLGPEADAAEAAAMAEA